jgi:undecaprenyl pyrophosphate phosphatase UppP
MLTEREKKMLARYEQQLAQPKWKFVFTQGVLVWGILTAILYTVITMTMQKKTFNEVLRKDLWINLATFMIAGIFFGLAMRWLAPKQIKKLKDKESLS